MHGTHSLGEVSHVEVGIGRLFHVQGASQHGGHGHRGALLQRAPTLQTETDTADRRSVGTQGHPVEGVWEYEICMCVYRYIGQRVWGVLPFVWNGQII